MSDPSASLFFFPSSFQTSGNLYIWEYLIMLQPKRNGEYYTFSAQRERRQDHLPQEWLYLLKLLSGKDIAGLISPTPSGGWGRMHTCSAGN